MNLRPNTDDSDPLQVAVAWMLVIPAMFHHWWSRTQPIMRRTTLLVAES